MKFENTEVWGFKHALHGMRNPMNSWDKSDSTTEYQSWHDMSGGEFIIGKNDMELAQKLIRAGSEHRKFLRQIFVSVDITAPEYWWLQFDTYHIGVTTNSTSKMHKLMSKPLTIYDFEWEGMPGYKNDKYKYNNIPNIYQEIAVPLIKTLNDLRYSYLKEEDVKKKKKIWRSIIQLLPISYLQTRTITMNYENILNMIHQRKNHKLNEWSGKDEPNLPNFISWTKTLPYAEELLFLDEE